MIKIEIKISPIFYMGNKKKLINKGLIDLFPKEINQFVDLFAGSMVVSMNTIANKYIINDTNTHLIELYNLFKLLKKDEIVDHVESQIKLFKLPQERTRRIEFKDEEKLEQYKNRYVEFRRYYNQNKDVLDFYTLMFYSFSQQFRFNSKGEFNMPYGTDCFSDNNKIYIENGCDFFRGNNVSIFNKDFRDIKIEKLTENDFVYLDPPYFNTTSVYNENGGWIKQDENDLYELCENLNNRSIKWGMSNVFKCKGLDNAKLIDWCNKNDWTIHTFDKLIYSACGKGNSEAKEVYICNY